LTSPDAGAESSNKVVCGKVGRLGNLLMKTVRFDNLSERDVELIVEPWAWAGVVAPDGLVEIHYSGEDADVIEFALTKNGAPSVGVISNFVRIRSGEAEFEFGSPASQSTPT
jgi:hypothetical protein